MAKLLTPGPVELHPRVLRALQRQMISHRSGGFHRLYREARELLAWLAGAEGPVLLLAGTGTTAVDAAVWSTICPGDRVLALVWGEFGRRMAETARRRGALVDVLEAEPGSTVDLERAREALEARRYRAILLVHCETSTATLYPWLRELAKTAQETDTLLLVDSVSGFAGHQLSMSWGLDVVATASHKALAAPPGAAIVFLSERGVEAARRCSKTAPLLLDLSRYIDFDARSETPYTPPLPALYGLVESLKAIREAGLASYIEEHRVRAVRVYQAMEELGFTPVPAAANLRCNTVVAAWTPYDAVELRKALETAGYIIATGMGEHRHRMVRVGVMGYISREELEGFTKALAKAVERFRERQ